MSGIETDMDQVTDSDKGDSSFLLSDSEYLEPRYRKREKVKQKQAAKRTSRSSTKSPPTKREKAKEPISPGQEKIPQTIQPTTNNPGPVNSSFFTPNPFSSLAQNVESHLHEQRDEKSFKPPPIYVKQVTNFYDLCKKLEQDIGKDTFTSKSRSSDTVFNFTTPSAFRAAVHFFENNNAPFHTYQLKDDKAFRVVFRNLHPSIPIETIKCELEEKGFSVRNISNVRQRGTKTPLPLFFIELNPSGKNKEIFQVQHIAYSKITVEEPYARRDIVQCVRCQEYGHTKRYCHYQMRCVKCAGHHAPQECRHPRTDPCVCALCGGSHPANYKGCSKYRDIQEKRQNPRGQTRRNIPPQNPPPTTIHSDTQAFPSLQPTTTTTAPPQPTPAAQPPRTFSNVLRGQQATPQVPPSPLSLDLTSLVSTFSNLFSHLKSLITPLIPLLQTFLSSLLPVVSAP